MAEKRNKERQQPEKVQSAGIPAHDSHPQLTDKHQAIIQEWDAFCNATRIQAPHRARFKAIINQVFTDGKGDNEGD